MKTLGADVLEIGAGTGGAKQTLLEAFGCRGDALGSFFGCFTFTDVSAGFCETASQKLAPWTSMMDFVKLNIELDPVEQSFAANSNDLIVASMVLHATESLHKIMPHVRKLLKPGGKVLSVKTTKDRLDVQLILGTLPGWLLSQEPFRKHSPSASLKIWEDVSRATGFTGVDFHVDDCERTDFQSSSIILTTVITNPCLSLAHFHRLHNPTSAFMDNTTRRGHRIPDNYHTYREAIRWNNLGRGQSLDLYGRDECPFCRWN